MAAALHMSISDHQGQQNLCHMVPDLKSVENEVAAAIHRFGCEMPQPQAARAAHFRRYVEKFIKTHLPVADPDDLLSFEDWLAQTSYPGSRKASLLKLHNDIDRYDPSYAKNNSFLKDEAYHFEPSNPKYKAPRAINSYTDESKALIGRFCQLADHTLFHSPTTQHWFVKGSNPKDWPRLLLDRFGDRPVMGTDFTSFEAHHEGLYAEIGEMWISHVLSRLPDSRALRLMRRMIRGVNDCRFNFIRVMLVARLMSGSMTTSSQNAFLNLVILSYARGCFLFPDATPEWLAENVNTFYNGLHEGDDGLFEGDAYDPKIFEELGVKLKLDMYPDFNHASFCGIICTSDLTNITNPLKIFRNFPYLSRKYYTWKKSRQLSLYRAKALSYYYLYRNCPIVGPFMKKILDETKHIDARTAASQAGDWKLSQLFSLAYQSKVCHLNPEITPETRNLMHEVFGYSPEEQLRLENEISASTGLHFTIDLAAYSTPLDLRHIETYHKSFQQPDFGVRTVNQYFAVIAKRGIDVKIPANPQTMAYEAMVGSAASM